MIGEGGMGSNFRYRLQVLNSRHNDPFDLNGFCVRGTLSFSLLVKFFAISASTSAGSSFRPLNFPVALALETPRKPFMSGTPSRNVRKLGGLRRPWRPSALTCSVYAPAPPPPIFRPLPSFL